ncbi:hypothetical protein D3C75_1057550 [compost metagenome]
MFYQPKRFDHAHTHSLLRHVLAVSRLESSERLEPFKFWTNLPAVNSHAAKEDLVASAVSFCSSSLWRSVLLTEAAVCRIVNVAPAANLPISPMVWNALCSSAILVFTS